MVSNWTRLNVLFDLRQIVNTFKIVECPLVFAKNLRCIHIPVHKLLRNTKVNLNH